MTRRSEIIIYFMLHTNDSRVLFRHTLITVSSREIIIVYGYMFYGTRISNKPFFGICRFSRPPFIKMAVVNTNVTLSQILHFLPSSELYLLHWLDLQKGQNSPLKWSRAVKNFGAHHYALNGSTLTM